MTTDTLQLGDVATARPALTMTVRMAPPRELSPNASLAVKPGHKNRLRDEWRKAWGWAAYLALGSAGGTVPWDEDVDGPYFDGHVRVTLIYRRGRNAKAYDSDNLIATCKSGADQLAKIGVLANDKQIVDWVVEQVRAEDGVGVVDVRIEAV